MTAYGPPPGPPGSPPPPPPGGGYGPPTGYGGGAPAFDPKSVNPFDWGILGGAVLALIFSFFSFYNYDAKGEAKAACSQTAGIPSAVKDLCSGDGASAWHGFFGWFGVLLVIIAAALVALAIFSPQVSLPVPARLVALGAAALGVISLLLALLVVPDWPPISDLGGVSGSQYDKVIDNGHGFSYWIVLVLAIVVAVLCFLRFQQTGGQLPGRPGAAGRGVPPAGYGQPQAPGYATPPEQGFVAPPPQQGYAPPPQQGYAAPPPQQAPPQGPPPGYGQQPSQQPPPGYPPPSQ